MTTIKGYTWYTMSTSIIGIIVTNNGFEDRAYIGVGKGLDEIEDAENIAKWGAKFPVEIAKQLI